MEQYNRWGYSRRAQREDRFRDLEAMRTVGKRVRQARLAKGLTLERTSELADTSNQFLSQIERGAQCMNAIKFGRLAQALGVSTDYLLFGHPAKTSEAALAAEYLSRLGPEEREMVSKTLKLICCLLDTSQSGEDCDNA